MKYCKSIGLLQFLHFPFNKINSYIEGGNVLYYYLSLTDLDELDNALMIFPNTNEVCNFYYAME